MRTQIDAAGRLVVPKALRDAVGLAPGTEVDIVLTDVGLAIEVVEGPGPHVVDDDGFLVVRPADPGFALADDEVLRLRDLGRR